MPRIEANVSLLDIKVLARWCERTATDYARAAVLADREGQEQADAHFDLWQDDMVVASASGPRAQAWAEIQHYAAMYGQDGPVQIEEVIRIPLPTPADAQRAKEDAA